MFERHTWPANRTSGNQPNPKENSHEEACYRRCRDRRLSCPCHGRRLSKRLHDPLADPPNRTPKGDTPMKKLIIAVALVVASAAPVMAEGFPNVYMTR